MFRAFFDETGTDPKVNKALVMGGFLGRVEDWELASDAWDKCLHETPSIEYFKHNEAQSLDGQFLRFNRTSAGEKVLALAETIAQFPQIIGVCVSVSYRSFKFRDAKAAKGMIGARVYDWGFLTSTSGVMQLLDDIHPGDEKVDFVFDERTELGAYISQYNEMKANPLFAKSFMHRAGQCLPGNDKEIAALQMADLLAWEFSKAGETRKRSDSFNVIAKSNKIVHIPCDPPCRLPNTLKLQTLVNKVHHEATDFLRRSKKGSPDRFTSSEEVIARFFQVQMQEAYVQLELQRHLSQQDADKEFQRFKKLYPDIK